MNHLISSPILCRALLAIAMILALLGFAMHPAPAQADTLGDFLDAVLRRGAAHRLHAQGERSNERAMRASWYGAGRITAFEPNTHTANGERFNRWGLTAAHRSLPFGTRLRVCFRACAVVRVNDRGPARWTGRSLDLSKGAALAVGLHSVGSGVVRVAVLGR